MPKILTIRYNNTGVATVPLTFETNLPRPLFDDAPTNWDVSVIRFRIPNFYTPLFTFINGTFTMTIKYKTVLITLPMIYTQWGTLSAQSVYYVQHFILMLNNLIASLCVALTATGAITVVSANYPYFIYNEQSELITYVSNKTYFATDGTVTDPILLYTNISLSQIIDGIPLAITSYGDQLLCFNTNNIIYSYIASGFYQMTSQNSIAEHIVTFTRLILSTNLPTQNEYISSSTGPDSVTAISQAGYPVLTDFVPDEITTHNFNNYITYNAITPYKQIALQSGLTIDNIKIYVYVENIDGSFNSVYVPPSASADIKLMFTPKNVNKFA